MPNTTNFAWVMPTVGGDATVWSQILNDLFVDIDADVQAIKVTADAAMPRAGGTFTGQVEIATERYAIADLGTMTGTVAPDLSTANFFYGTGNGSTAITIAPANVPASGKWCGFLMEITNGGAQVVNWPGGTTWPDGLAPVLQATGVDIVSFWTRNGGTSWRGALVQGNIS